jgi:RNA polymerase sigma-70 factor (ECF subfamily)
LVGILKHKVIDHFRKNSREGPSEDVERLINEQDQSFHGRGDWKRDTTGPKEWTEDPGIILERKEFWDVLKRCVSELPPRMAHAFSLREIDNLSSEEICKALNITATNLWVMLHRARMHLRRCLEINCMGLKAS